VAPKVLGITLGMSARDKLLGTLFQTMLGGGSLVEVLLLGVEDNLLVSWSPCVSKRGLMVEVLSPVGNALFAEHCCARSKMEGAFVLSQQSALTGFELVPFMEEELIPLDWSLGVSCDGHIEKLRAAFAYILTKRANKGAKKSVGGCQAGEKGIRELVNLFSGVNYEGGNESLSRSRSKGRGNRIVL
jgi:hypothetical protein